MCIGLGAICLQQLGRSADYLVISNSCLHTCSLSSLFSFDSFIHFNIFSVQSMLAFIAYQTYDICPYATKCSVKGLQYSYSALPCSTSPIAVNKQ